MVKNLPAKQETQVRLLAEKDPLEKEMETHPSTPAWEIHGQRSLAGYSPWGCESDLAEHTLHTQESAYPTKSTLSLNHSGEKYHPISDPPKFLCVCFRHMYVSQL